VQSCTPAYRVFPAEVLLLFAIVSSLIWHALVGPGNNRTATADDSTSCGRPFEKRAVLLGWSAWRELCLLVHAMPA
jgi:hypothetical protein